MVACRLQTFRRAAANWDRLHLRCLISCCQLTGSELCFVTNEVKPKAMHSIYLLVFENCCSLHFNSLTFIYKGLDKLSCCIVLHLINIGFVYTPSPPVNLSLSLHSSSIIDPVSILEGANSIQFEVRQCRSPTIRLILHFHVTCSFQVLLVFKIAWNIIIHHAESCRTNTVSQITCYSFWEASKIRTDVTQIMTEKVPVCILIILS